MPSSSSIPSSHRPQQHVDRKELYTNLEARIQYLHSFLDFSSSDIEAWVAGAKYIKALIPAVVNIVYKKLLQYDITARSLAPRSTSYEGPLDDLPSEDSPVIFHRKHSLRGYLHKLCSDPTKMEFWEYLDRIGMMHVGRGREHPQHVEYLHIGACLGFVQDVLNEAILTHPRLPLDRKIAVVKALGKVIWIQNDLFARWYVRDTDEYNEEMEQVVIEREGFFHGKRIIREGVDTSDEDEYSSTNEGPPLAVCPFSSMSTSSPEGIKANGDRSLNGAANGEA